VVDRQSDPLLVVDRQSDRSITIVSVLLYSSYCNAKSKNLSHHQRSFIKKIVSFQIPHAIHLPHAAIINKKKQDAHAASSLIRNIVTA
jgi:hypothetical protein